MKKGINMLLWTTFVDEKLLPTIGDIKKTGYDGIEVPIFSGDQAHYKKLGRQLADIGLECTASGILPDEQHSAVSSNPRYRKGAVEHLKSLIDRAYALEASMLIGPFLSRIMFFYWGGCNSR